MFVIVTLLMILLRAVAVSTRNDSYFYIYEWPSYMSDVYPPVNSTLEKGSSYSNEFNMNKGAGAMLYPDVGLFQTWQFSLYKNLMQRLLVSKYRTRCTCAFVLYTMKLL